MEMLLMGLCMSVFGLGVAALAFGAATRSESSDSAVQPELPLVKAVAPARFFSDRVPVPPAVLPRQVPIEVLLLQIENHVRLAAGPIWCRKVTLRTVDWWQDIGLLIVRR